MPTQLLPVNKQFDKTRLFCSRSPETFDPSLTHLTAKSDDYVLRLFLSNFSNTFSVEKDFLLVLLADVRISAIYCNTLEIDDIRRNSNKACGNSLFRHYHNHRRLPSNRLSNCSSLTQFNCRLLKEFSPNVPSYKLVRKRLLNDSAIACHYFYHQAD